MFCNTCNRERPDKGKSKGMCKGCYEKQRLAKNPRKPGPLIVCKMCNKERPHQAKGYCAVCYNKYLAEVNPKYKESLQKYYLEYGKKRWADPIKRKLEQERYNKWAKNNRNKRVESNKKYNQSEKGKARFQRIRMSRRASIFTSQIEYVDPNTIFSSEICGICGEPVDLSLEYPHPQSKSIDHIIPLSCGGTHTYDNLQLAHLSCNNKKGARV